MIPSPFLIPPKAGLFLKEILPFLSDGGIMKRQKKGDGIMPTVSIKLTEPQKRLLVLAPAGLIFVWVGWILAAQPGLAKVKSLKAAISTVDERAGLITEIQGLEKRRKDTEELLATDEMRYELLGKLTSLAKQSGFELQSLTPNVEQAEPYGRLTFNLKAQAEFPLLIRFLDKLENLKPGVAVYKISIASGQAWRRGRGLSGAVPQIDLTLETYLNKAR